MNLHTKAVHAGDRKKASQAIPVTTPIVTASSYLYESMEQLDRVFSEEDEGYCYARYDNPTSHALEEVITCMEGGFGSLTTSSGMSALQVALQAALTDRRRSIVAAGALYGASTRMLMSVFEPAGVDVRFVDICDLEAVQAAITDARPGCVLLETISNPLLRVGQIDRIAQMAREAGAATVVDSTFATPLLVRPLELGANLVVHSLTKYLAGHGDVLGGVIVSDEPHFATIRALARICGPNLGPFESYLAMRGIKTFPLRMERQCANACRIATSLASHPGIAKVYFPADPNHPDATTIQRIFPAGLYGAMISFELKDAAREQVFAFMDRLKLVVRGTSLGDVHSLMSYPAMSSHRDLAPKHRQRLGIGDNLVRLSVGIEGPEDILADLEQALG
ncbi:MAG: PLP-dependent transferase [Acidobacteriia bacterium]|nr:PLP-dependent transferase [Terriglobia bacterium]